MGEPRSDGPAIPRVETEADALRRELAASEQRYRDLLEHAPDPCIVHRAGAVVYVNPAGLRLYGARSLDDVLGLDPLDLIHPDDRALARRRIAQVLEGQPAPPAELRVVPRDGGEPITIESTARATVYGGAPAIQVLARDVTARRRAEREQATLQVQLAQAQTLAVVGMFASGVAHDIGNLLTAIAVTAELAPTRPCAAPADLQTIREAANRAVAYIRDLQAFTRARPPARRPLDLRTEVARCLPLLRQLAGPRVDVALATPPLVSAGNAVLADPVQLERCLVNLVCNARDAIGAIGTITLAVREVMLDDASDAHPDLSPGWHVELACTDSGGGIATATLPHIFEPFFTTKPGVGTGLGLAIVREIIRQHHGAITVRSTPQGTTFLIWLPRA